MTAFFRGLLVFLFGAIVGAGGVLFFTPSFNVVISRSSGANPPLEFVSPLSSPAAVAKAPAPVAPTAPAAPVAPVAPAKPIVVAAPTAPAAPVATADPVLDFKSISEHLILWPNSVSVKTATTVPVLVDGKKTQDLALEVGTVLQVSKVLADGSLEARAKGAKFEIKSALTDFNAELGKRVSELVAKGTKFDSPYPSAPMAPVAVVPAAPAVPAVVPAAPVAAVGLRWPQMTLAQRVDLLYGIKPEPETPVVPAPVCCALAPSSHPCRRLSWSLRRPRWLLRPPSLLRPLRLRIRSQPKRARTWIGR
jgi:hypothetical protein